MKYPTQHKFIKSTGCTAYRAGRTVWMTRANRSGEVATLFSMQCATVRTAKAWMNNPK